MGYMTSANTAVSTIAMGKCTIAHATMYDVGGNNFPSRCLYATYFCSTLNVSSLKLLKEMCSTQKSSMPSFSKPFSLSRSNHTLPRTTDVTSALNSLVMTKSLFRAVTVAWRARTLLKCVIRDRGYDAPYCALAKSDVSATSAGVAVVAIDASRIGDLDALHALSSASVVVGALASAFTSALLPLVELKGVRWI